MNNICADCIHLKVCEDIDDGIQMCYTNYKGCEHFKGKSRYIELPCVVGDVVWDKNGEPHKVISIEWYSSKVMHLHCEHRTFSVGKRSIGKAEQALKGGVQE